MAELAEIITDAPAGLNTSYIRSVGLAGAVVFFTLIILGEVSGLYSVSNSFVDLQSKTISIINQTERLEGLLDSFVSESADFMNDFNSMSSQPHGMVQTELISEYGYRTLLAFLNTLDVMINNIGLFLREIHHITTSTHTYLPGEQVTLMQHIHERFVDLILRATAAADSFRQIEEYVINNDVPITNEFGEFEVITRKDSFCFENPEFLRNMGIEPFSVEQLRNIYS